MLWARACNLSCMSLCSFSRTQHDGASPKRATRRGGLWWKTSQDQKTCCFFVADFTVALRFYTPPFDRGVLVSSSYTFVVLLFLCCFVKRAAWFSVHGATCRFRWMKIVRDWLDMGRPAADTETAQIDDMSQKNYFRADLVDWYGKVIGLTAFPYHIGLSSVWVVGPWPSHITSFRLANVESFSIRPERHLLFSSCLFATQLPGLVEKLCFYFLFCLTLYFQSSIKSEKILTKFSFFARRLHHHPHMIGFLHGVFYSVFVDFFVCFPQNVFFLPCKRRAKKSFSVTRFSFTQCFILSLCVCVFFLVVFLLCGCVYPVAVSFIYWFQQLCYRLTLFFVDCFYRQVQIQARADPSRFNHSCAHSYIFCYFLPHLGLRVSTQTSLYLSLRVLMPGKII